MEPKKDNNKKYDAFLCHASEDKNEIADKLYKRLELKGLKIWYDKFCLEIGDSIRQKIEEGLRNSNFGIVILSKNFFNKNWTNYEYNGLIEKEMSISKKIILPVWHKINKKDVLKYSEPLANKFACKTSTGINNVVDELLRVIKAQEESTYNKNRKKIFSYKKKQLNSITKIPLYGRIAESILKLTDSNFDSKVINSEKPLLVYFWASWCGPCKMMTPELEKLAEEKNSDVLKIGKLNVDENRDTAIKCGISSIPTLILFKEGKVIKKLIGAMSKDKILTEISRFL